MPAATAAPPTSSPSTANRGLSTNSPKVDGRELLYRNGPSNGGRYSANTLIFRARLLASIFGIIATLLVFLGTTEMFSLTAGLIALILFCFEPNLLAHGAYVTTDMAAACTIFATIYAFWRWHDTLADKLPGKADSRKRLD